MLPSLAMQEHSHLRNSSLWRVTHYLHSFCGLWDEHWLAMTRSYIQSHTTRSPWISLHDRTQIINDYIVGKWNCNGILINIFRVCLPQPLSRTKWRRGILHPYLFSDYSDNNTTVGIFAALICKCTKSTTRVACGSDTDITFPSFIHGDIDIGDIG